MFSPRGLATTNIVPLLLGVCDEIASVAKFGSFSGV